MKKTVKDKVTGQRKYALGTGGGPPMPPPNLTKEEEGIFSLISVQAAGTESVCDSDYQHDTPVQTPSQISIILTDNTVDTIENDKENLNSCETIYVENELDDQLSKWSDYTPKTIRTKPSQQLKTADDKEKPFRRYQKRNNSGQLTNKAWTDLANEELCQMKKEHLQALIAESASRKRYYDLQNQILEIELSEKKNKDSHLDN